MAAITIDVLQDAFIRAYEENMKIPIEVVLSKEDEDIFCASIYPDEEKRAVTHISSVVIGEMVPVSFSPFVHSGSMRVFYEYV